MCNLGTLLLIMFVLAGGVGLAGYGIQQRYQPPALPPPTITPDQTNSSTVNLQVFEPALGELLHEPSVPVSGRSLSNSHVLIFSAGGQQAVETDASGLFSTMVALEPGINRLSFVAFPAPKIIREQEVVVFYLPTEQLANQEQPLYGVVRQNGNDRLLLSNLTHPAGQLVTATYAPSARVEVWQGANRITFDRNQFQPDEPVLVLGEWQDSETLVARLMVRLAVRQAVTGRLIQVTPNLVIEPNRSRQTITVQDPGQLTIEGYHPTTGSVESLTVDTLAVDQQVIVIGIYDHTTGDQIRPTDLVVMLPTDG